MEKNEELFRQISDSLAGHFEGVHYVELETGKYIEYSGKDTYRKLRIPPKGDDFYTQISKTAEMFVHPDDLSRMLHIFEKDSVLKNMTSGGFFTTAFRLVIGGEMIRVRHIEILTEDGKHVICCLEDIENEVRREEERAKDLQSARKMARRDELTGVRNKNAYQEYVESIENNIKGGLDDYSFGLVICDLNDLKLLNDTRGHSFGDEAIQRSSRMICETFNHSPIFRIGGDEFVAVLSGRDYEERETLLGLLKGISIANGRSRSGPVVACGMAVYDSKTDTDYADVFERADKQMYEDKAKLKTMKLRDGFNSLEKQKNPITDDRRRKLDAMFGALFTIAGDGYVYLCDMKHDFSRWSLSLVDDFDMPSEYMYHAGAIWEERLHPEDLKAYRDAVNAAFSEDENATVKKISYRIKNPDGEYVVCTTRAFILSDDMGEPEYFGGVILTQ